MGGGSGDIVRSMLAGRMGRALGDHISMDRDGRGLLHINEWPERAGDTSHAPGELT